MENTNCKPKPPSQVSPGPSQPTPEASTLDSYRQHMTGDFLHGKPSPDVQAVIDQGHIPDIPAEW